MPVFSIEINEDDSSPNLISYFRFRVSDYEMAFLNAHLDRMLEPGNDGAVLHEPLAQQVGFGALMYITQFSRIEFTIRDVVTIKTHGCKCTLVSLLGGKDPNRYFVSSRKWCVAYKKTTGETIEERLGQQLYQLYSSLMGMRNSCAHDDQHDVLVMEDEAVTCDAIESWKNIMNCLNTSGISEISPSELIQSDDRHINSGIIRSVFGYRALSYFRDVTEKIIATLILPLTDEERMLLSQVQ